MGSVESRVPGAREIAFRLWPGPDPVDFMKREAVSRLVLSEATIDRALSSRKMAAAILFEDLGRLHIRGTRTEEILAIVVSELRRAAGLVAEALEFLEAARLENDIRNLDKRVREREERRGMPA